MRSIVFAALIAITPTFATVTAAEAGAIERACNQSDRKASNRRLCSCIQSAADATLSRSHQRRAAKFFRDPHKAQVTRQSDRASDEALWKAYKTFRNTAKTYCS